MAAQLLFAGVLRKTGPNAYTVQPEYSQLVGYSDDLRLSPPVTLCCGGFDAHRLLTDLGAATVAIPDSLAHGLRATPRAGDVPFEEAVAVAARSLQPFELGLELLKSSGLRHLAVHMAVPWNLEPSGWHPNAWHDLVPLTQRCQIVINSCIARICERAGVVHIDIWRDLVGIDGWREPRFTLDTGHVNYAASVLAVERLLDAFAPVKASAGV